MYSLDDKIIKKALCHFKTPFYIYDEDAIRKNVRNLYSTFSWNNGFREYFAVKATPNPSVMKILLEEGCGFDCSSLGELVLSEKIGNVGENIMFTSNNTPASEYKKAFELGAIINFDDISHFEYFQKNVGPLPEMVSCRYNPGNIKTGNSIIGHPVEAKYGFTKDQIIAGYGYLKKCGISRLGLHTMVVSNELDHNALVETARIMFELAVELYNTHGIVFEFINLGGGIGIPYKPEDKPVDINLLSDGIRDVYRSVLSHLMPKLRIYLECGRVITGPYGYLITKAIHKKNTYKNYVGVDASMADLMRPGMYGAYHHIDVLGKGSETNNCLYDITGSLCENNDKFAINRELPRIEIGDVLIIHDVGAHGHAMGFNYNAKLRCAELLARTDGSIEMIRRPETLDDYFSTLNF